MEKERERGEGKINALTGIINLGARFALKIAPPLRERGGPRDNFFAREPRSVADRGK